MTVAPVPAPPEPPPEPSTLPPELRASCADYLQRLKQAERALLSLDSASARVANLRGVTFLAACAVGGLAIFDRLPRGSGWAVAPLLFLYLGLVVRHARLAREEVLARGRAELNQRGLARLTQGWKRFAGRGDSYARADHPCAPDLDLFGQGSLFQLLDETATADGERTLARYLTQRAEVAEARARQGAVQELAPLVDFRQELVVECRQAAATKADVTQFIAWAEGQGSLNGIRWARPLAFVLPVLTLGCLGFGRLGWLPPWAWYLPLLLQIAVAALTMRPLARYWELLSTGEGGFSRFAGTFAVIERQHFSHPLLRSLRKGLEPQGALLSVRFRRFARAFGFAEARRSGQLFAVLHLSVLWDLHTLFALDDWRRANGASVRRWFEALAELEALCSFAGYAHARPHHVWPMLQEGPPLLWAQGLGHPLLDAPVRNDVALGGDAQAFIITGSNMSGKTTLLRALGLNAVMAQAGLPVCAAQLRLSPLAVLTSMRVKDSLERGVSYFYAEVQRIKQVLDAAVEARGHALFLIDELLLGTNARERQVASREVIRLLVEAGAIGAVTTHDLDLTRLEEDRSLRIRNVHFRDQLRQGEMCFDYQLREGVVDTTNALRVMQRAGIAIRGEPG